MDINNILNSKLPVLILGETGTGKSHYAKSLITKAKHKKFIQLNIASLSGNIFESELFGHVKGAFTGAEGHRIGFCESVGTGTLFLDEIGELSLDLQAKILTLIDEKYYYPVGSCQKKEFLGRLVFATNCNLEDLVEAGKFRKDLYYRIRLITKKLMPLRERSDLFGLIMENLNNLKVKYQKNISLSAACMKALENYDWPGNYRELQNTLEVLFLSSRYHLTVDDLPGWISSSSKLGGDESSYKQYYDELYRFEVAYFKRLLGDNEGRVNQSSQVAGISKVTLISKLKKYGINRLEFKRNYTANAG